MCELEDPVLGRDKLCGFDEIIKQCKLFLGRDILKHTFLLKHLEG
jgi:hypothetical protein